MAKQNIVIIGAGPAGSFIAGGLAPLLDYSKFNLILVTRRSFDVWQPALVRAVVSTADDLESFDHGAFIKYDKVFPEGTGQVKVGTVTQVVEGANGHGGVLHFADGETLDYRILVLAPGSAWEGPPNVPETKPEVDAHLNEWRARFKNAKHVLLIGGGTVGAEIAGEIKDIYPNKPVTIVQGGPTLLNDAYPKTFRTKVLKGLQRRGVEVICNDYVDNVPEGYVTSAGVTTRSGKRIPADLVVPARGGRPATEFLRDSGLPMTGDGFIRVHPTLQVKGHPSVFAAGDAVDWNEQKQVLKYVNHAKTVVPNIFAALGGQELKTEYKGSTELVFLTNGKHLGTTFIGSLWGLQFGNFFTKKIKSDNLLIPTRRKALGYA